MMVEGSKSLLATNQLSLPPVIVSPRVQRNDSTRSHMLKLSNKLLISGLQQSNILLSPRGAGATALAPIRGQHNQHFSSQSRSPKLSGAGIAINDDPIGENLRKASLVQAMSLNPSPRRQRKIEAQQDNGELNSDIMVLISKPRGVSKVDPLRLQKSLASSSESNLSDLDGTARKNFNYPPDLRTAQYMIKHGSQMAGYKSPSGSRAAI